LITPLRQPFSLLPLHYYHIIDIISFHFIISLLLLMPLLITPLLFDAIIARHYAIAIIDYAD
jgi:hypothetical protein